MLDRFFQLTARQTHPGRELLAAVTTFLTASYILFVQPAVLSQNFAGQPTGLDYDAVLLATCLASALATLIMGLYANYPIAQAPGMGQNFFFVATIGTLAASQIADPWRVALGIVFVSGVLFLGLSLGGVRLAIFDAVSGSLRHSIAVGIGLFIAFIGLRNAGVIVDSPGTLVQLNDRLWSADQAVFWFGFVLTVTLHVWRVRGSILWGILAAFGLAMGLKAAGISVPLDWPQQITGWPSLERHAILQMDLATVFRQWQICLPFVFMFLFMTVFDTMGTLIGVAEQAGLIRDGRLPRAQQALASDAIGTVAGAALGTSTVTSYIESAAGVEQGGRTGLVAVFVAALFLLALAFSPLIRVVGGYPPLTAPALVLVGGMMCRNVTKIDWQDTSEAAPALLVMLGIPLCFSIADGMALGLITYPLIKLLTGRARQVHWLTYVLAAVLLAYFLLLRAGA
jgi:AGZA family xanthine/uracil permease-like MFS transporter